MSATTYTLEEVAERTERALEDVRNAVEKGNLALAQNTSHERPRVTRVELERWKDMAEEHERIEEQTEKPPPDARARGRAPDDAKQE
jgi:hypothetical protein